MAPRFLFFAGKGGVGKTTCAAAYAVAAAARGLRVAAVSTDPAHSLGDVLATRLSASPRVVRVRDSRGRRSGVLEAAEFDSPRAFARWLAAHGEALGDALEHGTWLDRDDIDDLLRLPVPGLDELMALLEIVKLAAPERASRSRGSTKTIERDLVVVDTAPTGHALRLFAAPDSVAAVADVLDSLQAEHRSIRNRLSRVIRPDAADRLIDRLAEEARLAGGLLTDPRQSEFRWVMLPEELSLAETVDGVKALARSGIRVREVVVNRVLPRDGSCPVCATRRAAEREVIGRLPRQLGPRVVARIVGAEAAEPSGVERLASLGRALMRPYRPARDLDRPGDRRRRGARSAFVMSSGRHRPTVPEGIARLKAARLLLVCGKGGVGKTTVAAAIALRMARADPSRRVLLISTDPAHSIGDVLAVRVNATPTRVPGAGENMRAREIDAPALLAARRREVTAAADDIAASVGAAGHAGMTELLDLAPPGIDELLAMIEVANVVAQSDSTTAARGGTRRRLVVLDMAPTGHAIRLLQMPDAAREWVRVILRLLLKYREIVRPGRVAAELVAMGRSIRLLKELLVDPERSCCVVVTRAEEAPRLETARLREQLTSLGIAAPIVVINALTLSPGACRRCRGTAAAERRQRSAIERACRRQGCAIILTPLAAPPPRGIAALLRWSDAWARAAPVETRA